MARATYVLRDGQLVDKRFATPLHRAEGSGPNIRTDGMDAIVSMADGQTYDSKSAYYASVRRAGCEIVGDDRSGFGRPPEARSENVGRDIKTAIEQLRAGYRG